MGSHWGRKTRKRMRWRELRYETLYYVPSLSIDCITAPDISFLTTETDIYGADWENMDLSMKYVVGAEQKTDS